MFGWFSEARIFSLPCEPGQPLGIVRERVRQDLQSDVAIQRRVAGPINLSHAAFADRRDDFVDAERYRVQRQLSWIIGRDGSTNYCA